MNHVGIIQGRLSPRPAHHIQAFPWDTWEQEFPLARECGFAAIEIIFESDSFARHPLWAGAGRQRIREVSDATGMSVPSVCADFFMVRRLSDADADAREATIQVLRELIRNAAAAEIRCILLPLLEESSVRGSDERSRTRAAISQCLDTAADHGVVLGVETDLPGPEYKAFVESFDHPCLQAYFDTGNATALGFDAADDLRLLQGLLAGVHIKDRPFDGANVPLGEGDTDFAAVFQTLADVRYVGPLILQTHFGGDHVGDARRNLDFVKSFLDRPTQAAR